MTPGVAVASIFRAISFCKEKRPSVRGPYIARLAGTAFLAIAASTPAAAGVLDQTRASGVLRLLWMPDAAPFSFALNGQPAGYEIDLCRRIAAIVAPGLKVEWQSVSLADGLKQIGQGQGDLLCGPITITLGRMAQMDFTSPIFIGGPAVLLRSDAPSSLSQWLSPAPAQIPSMRSLQLETAAPRKVAVQQGSTGAAWLQDRITQDHLDVTVLAVPNDKAAEQLLATGQVEAWVSERAVLETAAAHDPGLRDAHLLLPHVQRGEPLAIAMPKDAQFSMAVETALAHIIRGPDADALFGTWFGAGTAADADVIRGVTPLE
jgi:polar amino acid transport system substrate-binding protein